MSLSVNILKWNMSITYFYYNVYIFLDFLSSWAKIIPAKYYPVSHFLSLYLIIYLYFIYLFIHLSIYLFIYLFICLLFCRINVVSDELLFCQRSFFAKSTKEQLSVKKRESVKLKESAENARPTADSMTLTCSTYNRQFRARIGLASHQRTHQHTRTYSIHNAGLSY